ncbi:MAG: aldo/keto reductase [Gemmatimonadota bacterium]
MRLSTAADRDEERAVAVIHAALDAGVRLFDTANVYCHGEHDAGHNERLIARALRTRDDGGEVEIVTKGGLRRRGQEWVPDGRARHLREACEASRAALGVDTIDLYMLHAVDPSTALQTSVRALATLRKSGVVRRVGLCNVTVSQIEVARDIVEIDAVEVAISPVDDENLRNGVARYCIEKGIRLIAHRPLGGDRWVRFARDPQLVELAQRCGLTPAQLILAWLGDLGAISLAGCTRVETARTLKGIDLAVLDDDLRRQLDDRFGGALLRSPRASRRPMRRADGEVVLVMGMPGAGKSTLARRWIEEGYARLNRDQSGGSLRSLAEDLDRVLASGNCRVVLDNTYATRSSRNLVVECAWKHGVEVRCIWLATPLPEAQINAVNRILGVHGSLPSVEETREPGKRDTRFLGPDAQFRYERTLEPPSPDEGFSTIETVPFVRQAHDRTPGVAGAIVEFDGAVVEVSGGPPLDPGAVKLAGDIGERMRSWSSAGMPILVQAWRPQITVDPTMRAQIEECFARTRELVGVDFDVGYCIHPAGPPICWCRKPLPGLALEFAARRRVDLTRSTYLGRGAADRTLAERLKIREYLSA